MFKSFTNAIFVKLLIKLNLQKMANSNNRFVCQWTLEIVYGKQKQALDIIKKWGEEKFRSSHFKVSVNRVMNGYVGASPSLIIDEYIFNSMDDFEKAGKESQDSGEYKSIEENKKVELNRILAKYF